MRELTAEEQKTVRRLRAAFRRAAFSVVKQKGTTEQVKLVCQRVTAHAIKLGWLTVPPSSKVGG